MEAVMEALSVALWLRESFQDSADCIEGVDLYTWYWAPARAHVWEVVLPTAPVPDCIPTVRIKPTIELSFGDIRFRARFGVDHDRRIAVLFWGSGGPSIDIPQAPHAIERLTQEGAAKLAAERREGKRRKLDEYMEKDDPEDGEDWKK